MNKYPYLTNEGVPVADPLFDSESDGDIPTSPKQLVYREIDVPTAIQLNELWHSRLPKVVRGNIDRNRRRVCYVAEYGNRFYAVAIWTDPVAGNRLDGGDLMLELRRMAISPQSPKNTASSMISWMRKQIQVKFPDLTRLISYQDSVVHLGTIYKASGWVASNKLSTLSDWNTNGRQRKESQAPVPKIRWEFELKRPHKKGQHK